jgi:hypothetical protein
MKTKRIDVTVSREGIHLTLFRPASARARRWLERHTIDPLWFGGALAVEARFAPDLASGIAAAGFTVAGEP